MEIVKYDIIDKVIDKTKPFFDKEKGFFVFRIQPTYRYYLQARQYNSNTCQYEYFLIMGLTNFNSNCRRFRRDDFGRYKVRLTKELKDYVLNNIEDNLNFELNYIESLDSCDVWQII